MGGLCVALPIFFQIQNPTDRVVGAIFRIGIFLVGIGLLLAAVRLARKK